MLIVILTLALFLAGSIAISYEKGIWVGVAIAAYLAGLFFIGHIDIVTIAKTNWEILLWALPGYITTGTFWGLFKWYLWNRKKVRVYFQRRIQWAKERNIDLTQELTPQHLEHFEQWWNSKFTRWGQGSFPKKSPREEQHRLRIIKWMGYWPLSLIETAFNHVAVEIWHIIYERISGTLQGIADHVWKKVMAEHEQCR